MMRRLTTFLAVLAIFTAACGDDDDPSVAGDDVEETADEAPMGPAELQVEDQSGDGSEVVVASVTLPADGFVVVHADADGAPGAVIGHTELLPSGESTDVTVSLDAPLDATAAVWPMVHVDTNENGEYDFDPPDSTEDGPATFEDGEVATLALELTVEAAGGGGDDGAGEEATSVTVVDFSFDPETVEVAAGGTVTWTNEDGTAHTVTAGSPGSVTGDFDESLSSGASADITFDEVGTFDYFCTIHPAMAGQVVVS